LRFSIPAAAFVVLAAVLVGLEAPGAARRLVEVKPIHECELMVVLGGGSLERLATAVELHEDGACEKVLITGEPMRSGLPRRETLFAELGPESLLEPDTITESTYDDALLAFRIARREGYRHLLVVTSPYHTRRVIWIFSRILAGTGIQFGVQPSESLYMDYDHWWRNAHGRGVILSEYAKIWLCGLVSSCLRLGAFVAAAPTAL